MKSGPTGAGEIVGGAPRAGGVVGARRLPARILAALRDAAELDDAGSGRLAARRFRPGRGGGGADGGGGGGGRGGGDDEVVDGVAAAALLSGVEVAALARSFAALERDAEVHRPPVDLDAPHAADETRRRADVAVGSETGHTHTNKQNTVVTGTQRTEFYRV